MNPVAFFIVGKSGNAQSCMKVWLSTFNRKYRVSRGENPLGSGSSNRGEKHPCWHTILLAKSSVLYLLRPLTLERGCPTPDRPFSASAEQADFVGCKIHKMKDLS